MTPKQQRALQLRDAALTILRDKGVWKENSVQQRMQRFRGFEGGSISITLRTPFQKMPEQTNIMKYVGALLDAKPAYPYGIDIWYNRKKVMNLEWDADGQFDVVSLHNGLWEEEVLGMLAQ